MPISSSSEHLNSLLGSIALAVSRKTIVFEGLEFDSREIKGGELFICLPGEQQHGNSYITQALARGAALVLADRQAALPEISEPERVLLVNKPLEAFWRLAAWWRDQIALPTIAVTGSVGKTTVKEMLAAILLQRGPGTFSLKSHNNQVGVPYTICRASRNHCWLVLEIGMNHRGEIAPLAELARPDVAVISKIAAAHIGNLGSMEAILDEKLDIGRGLKKGGTLLVNSDIRRSDAEIRSQLGRNDIVVKTFGEDVVGEGKLSNVLSKGVDGIAFDLQLVGETLPVSMKVLGRHNAWNAAAAASAARLLFPDFSGSEITLGLQKFTAPLMRLNVKILGDGSAVVDDSYNANPASVASAIEQMIDLRKDGERLGFVLGDMLELGDFSTTYHRQIAELIASANPEFLLTVGAAARNFLPVQSLIRHSHCENVGQAIEALKQFSFDFLLVKGSRGIGLDALVRALLAEKGELNFAPPS